MQVAAFAAMCLIWGLTWLAMKFGIAAVPPLVFAGLRLLAAGGVLLAARAMSGSPFPFARADWGRVAAVTLLMMVATYGLLFWGMLFVPSGLAAVLDLAVMPLALLLIGAALGEERIDRRRALGVAVGTAGLLMLFGPKAVGSAAGTLWELAGAAAILASTVAYAWGSILARPVLRHYPSDALAAVTTLAGGVVLTALALLIEPGAVAALTGSWGLAAWLGWLFLVLFGTLLAYTIYLRLLRDWGPVRAGSYAFISPAVAVLTGVLVLDERVTALDLIGMATMLAGAWLCVPANAAPGIREKAACRSMS